jgi:VWFA-related protein
MSPIRGCMIGLVVLSVVPLYCQTPNPDSSNQVTFRTNVRRVLVDVVVTSPKDEPVTGLHKEDFQVFENGQPQTLASFDEHAGLPDMSALQAELPPNTFSNLPLVKAGDAANILLLDALNTQMSDQSYVHAQMIKYIKGIRPGTRLALFTLGARLRFVQGFTGDPAVLMAAVSGKNSAGNPQLSNLLQTSTQIDADNRLVAQMQEMAAAAGIAADAGVGRCTPEVSTGDHIVSRTDVRVQTTSGSVPAAGSLLGRHSRPQECDLVLRLLPDFAIFGDRMTQYQDEVTRTANLLAAAQIAVYPLAAQGLGAGPALRLSVIGQMPPQAHPQPNGRATGSHPIPDGRSSQAGSTDRNSTFAAMDELARNTGGEAYKLNDLNEELDHVLKHGTHYYSLSYSPSNKNMDGELRHIEVKVSGGSYQLSYRRGYYAKDEALLSSGGLGRSRTGDPLRPLMDHGTPDSTAIVLYHARVLAASPQASTTPYASDRAGDNENLKGASSRATP